MLAKGGKMPFNKILLLFLSSRRIANALNNCAINKIVYVS